MSKLAEHHEQATKAHRMAAQQHGSNDHVSAKQQSAQAFEKSKAAHKHSTHTKSRVPTVWRTRFHLGVEFIAASSRKSASVPTGLIGVCREESSLAR
jgi:hypothetical protein